MAAINPFSYVESAGTTKIHSMCGTENDQLAEKDYLPFLINKTFSFHPDTIEEAQDMNMRAALPTRLQYDYYFYSVRPRRRPKRKWGEKQTNANIELVQEAFGFGYKRALEACRILTQSQLAQINTLMTKGGKEDGE